MGCRNIFFRGEVQEDGSTRFARECNCPRSELIVVEEQGGNGGVERLPFFAWKPGAPGASGEKAWRPGGLALAD